MRGQPLFEKVVELCGVSAVLAPGLVRRALLDGKVAVPDATSADYRTALPRLLARLRAYMPEDEAQRRSRRISTMLAAIEGAKDGDDAPPEGRLGGRLGTPSSGTARLPEHRVAPPGDPTLDYDDEPTLMGRRFTAHELLVRSASEQAPEGPPKPGATDDASARKPKR